MKNIWTSFGKRTKTGQRNRSEEQFQKIGNKKQVFQLPQNPQTKQQKTPKDTNMDYELPKAVNFMEELTNLSDNKQDWILPY